MAYVVLPDGLVITQRANESKLDFACRCRAALLRGKE